MSDPDGRMPALALAPALISLGPVGAVVGAGIVGAAVGYYGTQYLLENMHGAPASSYTKDGWTYGDLAENLPNRSKIAPIVHHPLAVPARRDMTSRRFCTL